MAAEHQFKPGHDTREALELAWEARRAPPGFKFMKHLTKKELVDVGNVLIKGDIAGLRRAAQDPHTPALVAIFSAILLKIHATGDMDAFDKLLNRFIGKVREEVHHGGSIGGTQGSTVVVTLPSNGREVKTIDAVAHTMGTQLLKAGGA